MKRAVASLFLALALGGAGGVLAQTTIQEARDQGNALGTQMRADTSLRPSEDKASQVPSYNGTTQPQAVYFDDPDRLVTDGTAQAVSSDAYGSVVDRGHTRPTFSNAEIKNATQRGTAIEGDPNTYLAGEQLGGSTSSCTALPPSSGPVSYYEATCNKGSQVTDTPTSCTGHIDTNVVNTLRYFYYGVAPNQTAYGFASTAVLNAKVAAGVCRAESVVKQICDAQVEMGAGGTDVAGYLKFCRKSVKGNAQQYSCSQEIPQGEIPDHFNHAAGTVYLKKEGTREVTVSRNEGTCPALAADTTCTAQGGEVCTQGPETRIIDGVPVTQDCWAWSRQFTCQRITQASDCSDLEANKQCSYLRDECLDDPQQGACKVSQKVYQCPVPSGPVSNDKQYVCGGDVYCLNGDCETIDRQASTEFKDALVALHSLGDAGAQFDPNNLTVFSGERGTCNHKLFGISNCCSGKGVPLLTPWLCSSAEQELDKKDDKGLCHKVGSYCSDKVLGICVTSKDAYCCFGSKLARILQEQGRAQIGKPWGKPKTETCKGFTIEEFQQLDLSKMDFTEVYAEFTEAAKLPSEVSTMADIQQKIQGYYDLHRGQ